MKSFIVSSIKFKQRTVNGFDDSSSVKELLSECVEVVVTLQSSGNTSGIKTRDIVNAALKQYKPLNFKDNE